MKNLYRIDFEDRQVFVISNDISTALSVYIDVGIDLLDDYLTIDKVIAIILVQKNVLIAT